MTSFLFYISEHTGYPVVNLNQIFLPDIRLANYLDEWPASEPLYKARQTEYPLDIRPSTIILVTYRISGYLIITLMS